MPLTANDVFIVNLSTGGYMAADYHALVERRMPEGYRLAEDVSIQGWLDAIAIASGSAPSPMPTTSSCEDTFVDLATGRSVTQHKAVTRDWGGVTGMVNLEEASTLDFLDALRGVKGIEPCDRERLGETHDSEEPTCRA